MNEVPSAQWIVIDGRTICLWDATVRGVLSIFYFATIITMATDHLPYFHKAMKYLFIAQSQLISMKNKYVHSPGYELYAS